jgi:predicted  nucleic acid-binding Zn-ribbon protein
MNDKEYLQEIKNDVFKQIDYSLTQGEVCDYISLEEEKVNWLIEQAQKVEQLQQEVQGLKAIEIASLSEIDHLDNEISKLKRQLQKAQVKVERYENALREIDTHIRSTPEPIPYIIQTLKATLPEYK